MRYDEPEWTYWEFIKGEAWTRGCYYTPREKGYSESKPWRGWINMLVRLLPHISRSTDHTGQSRSWDFTLTQIPLRRYQDGTVWAAGFYRHTYLGETEWHWTWGEHN